jgi:hypothetical protein
VPYWGEKVPGMDAFVKAFEAYAAKHEGVRKDFYILGSYIQGLTQLEVVKRAIESGDITRAGYLKTLKSLKEWTAGGMVQPVNLGSVPYVTSKRTRVLKPVMDKGTWEVAADYAEPKTAL